MESESNLLHKHTEQLINGMMSFLDDTPECYKKEDFDETKNPLCAGIKNIIEMFPPPPPQPPPSAFQGLNMKSQPFSSNNNMKTNHMDKACRYKDPYMQEVNRLMFCSTMGHPANGSPEYFQAAESYALYGKEFLDFPTDIKFPKPMDVSCFGDFPSQFPNSIPKSSPSQVFGMTTGKNPNMANTTTSVPQLPVMMNPTNYWGYPFYQTPNLVQPLMYSNPFLMTQYLNMFVRETQINTSIVQQQQFLSGGGGIHERLVYAQMLQQQTQTNQSFQGNSCLTTICSGNGLGKTKISKLQELKKIEPPSQANNDGSAFMKAILNVKNNLCENNKLEVDD
ncbi:uncharacterized protein LOC129906755 [Episyrphus balteatus]|uniref:uncharacterized protein LOC129906755 n=1 Tax=Episyrphus balteatus TaxID=286459 RepID=UPI002486AB31|nr:uncharacterized protein LOC129906755 [Episyrphus balteatus]